MRRSAAVALGALALACALAATARTPEAGAGWRLAFVVLALGGSAALVLVLRRWAPSVRLVLGVTVALRLAVLPLAPTLSDDGYRYVWDGRLQAQDGVSPYRFKPSDPALSGGHDSVPYRRMNSAEYFSVYPPLSQLVFWAGGMAYGEGWRASWWVIKGLTVLVELVGVVALVRLVGPSGAALYAWHPLAVVEVAGQGHTEGLLVGALGLFLLTVRRRPAWAGAALACAGWTKLFPFALAPLLLRRPRALAAFAAVAAGLAAPYASAEAVAHVRQSLGLYLGTFDFYAAPYLALKAALYPLIGEGAGQAAALALAAAWAAGAALLLLTDDGTARSARRVTVAVVAGYAVAVSTLHPWHLLSVLYVVPLLQNKKWMWLASVSPATYLLYVWPPAGPLALAVGWGGAAALAAWAGRRALLRALMRARARGKWAKLRPFLPPVRPGGRVLDLGAGEGWVGHAAAADHGLAVTAVDVARYGSGAWPVEVYDGRRLPYAAGTFDAALVVFVLHHAVAPRDVVREAVRVTAGPVLVLETVCRSPGERRRLERVDQWLNRLRSGGAIEEEPLHIRSDADWRRLFASLGVEVEPVRTWGGPHPQALYRLRGGYLR